MRPGSFLMPVIITPVAATISVITRVIRLIPVRAMTGPPPVLVVTFPLRGIGRLQADLPQATK
jgi:hypothetical protein